MPAKTNTTQANKPGHYYYSCAIKTEKLTHIHSYQQKTKYKTKKTNLPQKQNKINHEAHTTIETTWEILGMAEKQADNAWKCAKPACKKQFTHKATLTKHIQAAHAADLPKKPKQQHTCPYFQQEQKTYTLLERLKLKNTTQTTPWAQIPEIDKEQIVKTIPPKNINRKKQKCKK